MNYSSKLGKTFKTLLSIDSVPLKIVIELLSGKKVMDFDKNNKQHKFILDKLKDFATKTQNLIESGKYSIETKGKSHDLGKIVKIAFMWAVTEDKILTLKSKSNKENSLDCPQFVFQHEDLFCYITLKTHSWTKQYSPENHFELSHLENVTEDGLHFIISFNISKKDNIYNWSIVQIGDVEANIKRGFVFSNAGIYREENILAKRY